MGIEGGQTVLVVALVLGGYALPAALLLGAWRTPWSGSLRGLAASVALLYVINLVTLVGSVSWTGGPWFVAYNLAFFAIAGACLAAVALVQRLGALGPRGLWPTALVALGFWLAGLYGALVAPGGRPAAVFLAGTLLVAGVTLVLVAWLVVRRRTLAPGTAPWVWAGLGGLVPLIAASVANELAGLRLPLSPIFLAWGATLVYAAAARDLRRRPPEGGFDAWCVDRGLSRREREVLELFASGVERPRVAERLFLSPVTVKNHLAALYRKTGTSDLTTLIALARDHGAPVPPAPAGEAER